MRILNGISTVSLQSTRYLTDALKDLGHIAEVVVYRENPLLVGLEDENLNIEKEKYYMYPIFIFRIIKFILKSIKKYDIFHFHFGYSLLPFNLDLWILKKLNKKVFMEYHGSELRRKSVYESKNVYHNGFIGIEDKKSYKLQKRIAKNVDGIIVHDQELKEQLFNFDVNVYVLPLRINTKKFEPHFPTNREKLLIVHSPSKRETKGTKYIVEAIKELSKVYNIEIQIVEGLPNEKAKEIFIKADIIVDQLLIGTYGMFAIECMAYGKPTVCYIREDLLDSFPEAPPIYNANIDNIKDKLEELIVDFDIRYRIGVESRRYIEKYHDSYIIAAKALEIYNS